MEKLRSGQRERAERKQKLKDDPEISKVLPTFEKKHNLEKQLSQEKSKRGELEAKAKEIRKKAAEDMIKSARELGLVEYAISDHGYRHFFGIRKKNVKKLRLQFQ